MCGLGAEAAPASACGLGLRIDKLKARAVEPLDIIDLRPLEVLVAHHIDIDGHTMRDELLVKLAMLILEEEIVAKARTSTAEHANTERLFGDLLELSNFFDFFCGFGGELNRHAWNLFVDTLSV